MKEIEVFLQGEGLRVIKLVKVPQGGTVQDIIQAGRAVGLPQEGEGATHTLFTENAEIETDASATLEDTGIHHRGRVHIHRCHKIRTTVNFNNVQKFHDFSPSTTIEHVKKWATGESGFNLTKIDASEHILQLCGASIRPDDDAHIGSLSTYPTCSVCFDLEPKKRVEG